MIAGPPIRLGAIGAPEVTVAQLGIDSAHPRADTDFGDGLTTSAESTAESGSAGCIGGRAQRLHIRST